MKEIMDPLPAIPSVEKASVDKEGFANRKLIRPTLPRPEGNGYNGNHSAHMSNPAAPPRERVERQERVERSNDRSHGAGHDRGHNGHDRGDRFAGGGGGRKQSPPEQTNAENFYYQKQMQSRTPMVIVLQDGEEIHGVIEWYDRDCIKVNRDSGGPNLMIYKPAIKYMYKEGEGS